MSNKAVQVTLKLIATINNNKYKAMPTSEIYKFPLFKNVERSLITEILSSHSIISFPADMQLIRKGVYNNKVFFLLEGKASIRDKNYKPLKVIEAGSIFGEISVLDEKPASDTVMTNSSCKVLILTEDEIWSLSEKSHIFTSNLLQVVVDRLRSFSAQLDKSRDSAKSMQKKAYLDAATGLLNRTWLKEKTPLLIRQHKQHSNPLSFIMTDIDHFKIVNDNYGHDVGDLVLREVAIMLQSMTEKLSYVIRLGGDEMCVILPETSLREATIIAERARMAIEETAFKFSDSISLKISSSFGVSSLTEEVTMKKLMKQADIALYEAKNSGRNRIISFDTMLLAESDS